MADSHNDNSKSKSIAWILLALMGISLGAYLLFKKKDSSVSNGTEVVSDKFDVMCRGLEKEFTLKEGSVTSMSAFKKLISETK